MAAFQAISAFLKATAAASFAAGVPALAALALAKSALVASPSASFHKISAFSSSVSTEFVGTSEPPEAGFDIAAFDAAWSAAVAAPSGFATAFTGALGGGSFASASAAVVDAFGAVSVIDFTSGLFGVTACFGECGEAAGATPTTVAALSASVLASAVTGRASPTVVGAEDGIDAG